MAFRMLISDSRFSKSLLVSFWRETALMAIGIGDFCRNDCVCGRLSEKTISDRFPNREQASEEERITGKLYQLSFP
jgi:hypothetical protein